MSQKAAAIFQAVKFSKKCPDCGLKNFPDADQCKRCEADLSRRSTGTKVIKQISDNSGRRRQPRVRRVLIFAGSLAMLFALVLFYASQVPQGASQVPQGAQEAISEVPVAQAETSESAPDPAQQEAQSQRSATQVLSGLKHFQSATQSNMTYDQYDQMLSQLKNDLNSTLPSFVRHNPSDESFRQEVAAALRDYTAAGNWWKTTIRNSQVLTDADRIVRLQAEWKSAQTHLDKAEKLLLH